MGITTEWSDRRTRGFNFSPNTDYSNSDKVLSQKYWPMGETNDITIGMIFDFSETEYENKYRKFGDILSMLGG